MQKYLLQFGLLSLALALTFSAPQLCAQEKQASTALEGFQKYCMGCHQAYGNEEAIKQNSRAIYDRLTWMKDLNPVLGSMPPAGPFQDQLTQEPESLRQAMLDFVRPSTPVEPPPAIDEEVANLKLPPGFKIYRYARLKSARSMTISPSGTLFVGTGGFSNPDTIVYALKDTNGNQKIEDNEIRIVARGLNNPNGVAFRQGDLYVAETQQIRRFKNVEAQLASSSNPIALTAEQILPQRFPSGPGHAWKFIRFAPAPNDHLLYVPVGAHGNVHPETDNHAKIFRIDVRGSQPRELVANGVRNTVGFDFHPLTGELWFTDNGRDQLGDRFPPDELNKVSHMGEHFGFPYCHGPLRDDGLNKDPQFNQGQNCENFTSPKVALAPHAAALGMRFYTGAQFPQDYKNQIFIAEHGSWNVSPGNSFTGYKVSLVKQQANGNYSYEPFVQGWLKEDGRTRWGRPVDIETMPDGSLLISDDGLRSGANRGSIYRVVYTGQP